MVFLSIFWKNTWFYTTSIICFRSSYFTLLMCVNKTDVIIVLLETDKTIQGERTEPKSLGIGFRLVKLQVLINHDLCSKRLWLSYRWRGRSCSESVGTRRRLSRYTYSCITISMTTYSTLGYNVWVCRFLSITVSQIDRYKKKKGLQ